MAVKCKPIKVKKVAMIPAWNNNPSNPRADGVEYVVEAGKTVYHKVASSKEDLTEAPAESARSLDSDAEWLP